MCVSFSPLFFASAVKLSSDEQAQVNDFIVTFMDNPAHPSLRLHQLTRAKSPNIWSGTASYSIRVVLHKGRGRWTLLYADRHDDAYDWARRRKIEVGADERLQVTEIKETVREVEKVVKTVRYEKTPLFERNTDEYLLALGIPAEWLPAVREVRDEEHLLTLCEKVSERTAETLLLVGLGGLKLPKRDVQVLGGRERAFVIRGWREQGRSLQEIAETLGMTPEGVHNQELMHLEFPEHRPGVDPVAYYEAVRDFLPRLQTVAT